MADAMSLLQQKAVDDEENARKAMLAAQQALDNYRIQLSQIENYRLEYFRQLTERGKGGLTASSYGHLNKFINQLDETLVKQRNAGAQFEDNLENSRQHWMACRQQRKSIEWLIEKRQKEAAMAAEKREQKLMDEFAALSSRRESLF